MTMQKLENITPEKAKEYYEKALPSHQRPFRQSRADKYIKQMHGHQWMETHQGIAFDEHGRLIDGQHRMYAIWKSGLTIKMWVCRGLPECMVNGRRLETIDAIDRGDQRSVSDQLVIRSGIKNASRVATACVLIQSIATNGIKTPLTPAAAKLIICKYPILTELFYCKESGLRSGYIWGALAVACRPNPELKESFIPKLFSGEMIKKGEPVFALRAWLLGGGDKRGENGSGGSQSSERIRDAVLNCAFSELKKEKVSRVSLSKEGLCFFSEKQQRTLSEIAAFVGV
ncbi:MAG: hypothetical protein ACEQSM_06545 [Aliarcobacter sp.]